MERKTFLLKITGGKSERIRQKLKDLLPEIAAKNGSHKNFSVWIVDDMVFGYYETEQKDNAAASLIRSFFQSNFSDSTMISSPGNMRLMYSKIGSPRQDKNSLYHRVFMTKLKPDCAEEYKRRHDVLAAGTIAGMHDSPENNCTIWNAGDYICGYFEIDRDNENRSSPEKQSSEAAWESRMLEIMDWLTDDVDHISGEHHERIECLFHDFR